MPRPAPLILALLTAACTQFPELDARLTAADRSAPYPALVPLGPLIAAAGADDRAALPDLAARIAALRARAARLRGPVIAPADALRLNHGSPAR
ncbi:MAG: hypothetical protein IT542_11070 [Rubellimicrobium sp.]|nr:hypothetical protein [Rubellimicrobium sp.]